MHVENVFEKENEIFFPSPFSSRPARPSPPPPRPLSLSWAAAQPAIFPLPLSSPADRPGPPVIPLLHPNRLLPLSRFCRTAAPRSHFPHDSFLPRVLLIWKSVRARAALPPPLISLPSHLLHLRKHRKPPPVAARRSAFRAVFAPLLAVVSISFSPSFSR